MNTSEQLPDGVWFRNSPHQNDTNREPGFGVYRGELLAVDCWSSGDAVGPYGNTMWYRGLDVTRPTVNGHANYGYMNTHYINDGMNANQHAPGIPNCADIAPAPTPTPTPPPATPKYCLEALRINTANITWFYGGNHRYLGNALAAAKAWTNSGAGVRFTEASSKSKAILNIVDYNNGGDTRFAYTALGGNVIGATGSITPTRAFVSSATIYVNRAQMEKFPVPARNNVRDSTITHEFGHVLGLHHPEACGRDGTGTLMRAGGAWIFDPTSTFYTAPQADDITGVRVAFSY